MDELSSAEGHATVSSTNTMCFLPSEEMSRNLNVRGVFSTTHPRPEGVHVRMSIPNEREMSAERYHSAQTVSTTLVSAALISQHADVSRDCILCPRRSG